MTSPTQRSLKLLRDEGYFAQVVERFNPYARIRIDLFKFIDLVAIRKDKPGVLGVQTTSGAHLAERIKKAIKFKEMEVWLKAGNTLEFHGWRKLKNLPGNRLWDCKREVFTLKDHERYLAEQKG